MKHMRTFLKPAPDEPAMTPQFVGKSKRLIFLPISPKHSKNKNEKNKKDVRLRNVTKYVEVKYKR